MEFKGRIVLVVYPDFGGIPSCCAALLPHLSQNHPRDMPFKLPSMLLQGTVRRGNSITGSVAGG